MLPRVPKFYKSMYYYKTQEELSTKIKPVLSTNVIKVDFVNKKRV